jgi:preprotein translocase subunit YajC
MGILLTDTAASSGMSTIVLVVVYIAIFGFLYFVMIRPQRKEQKQKAQLLSQLAIGDSVRTTGGFIGTIIDVQDDMVIVEFGNNKNCRIPMVKEAIVEVEKPEDAVEK